MHANVWFTINKLFEFEFNSHKTCKCDGTQLDWKIRCFAYGDLSHSDVPRLQQVLKRL